MEKLISIKDAAAQLSCTESAIRKWLHLGKLKRIKIGRLTRLREADIQAIIRLELPL